MQLTLEALNQILAPVEILGQEETTFEVNGLRMTMRVLTPEQESEVQRYANEVFAGDNKENKGVGLEFMERFRLGLLSYAICEVGDQNLRTVAYVETGETLPTGVPVKIPTALALRQIIEKWGSTVRLGLFRKYGEMIVKVERRTEAAMQFEPSDLEAEIERLEARLTILKGEQAEGKQLSTPVSSMAKTILEDDMEGYETAHDNMARLAVQQAEQKKTQEVEPSPQVVPPRPVTEKVVPPAPVRQSLASSVKASPVPTPVPARPAPVAEKQPTPEAYPDSMLPEDSDAMAEAIAMENRRLWQMRNNNGAAQIQDQPRSVLDASRRRPPHAGALEDSGRYEVEEVTKSAPPSKPLVMDQVPNPGNPRFRRPGDTVRR